MTKGQLPPWEGPDGPVGQSVAEHSQRSLDVYRADPRRVDEDAGQEEDLATGGYGRRQVFELVQNGVDALLGSAGGRIEVLLTSEALYCANEGEALREDGVSALMHAHVSPKRGIEIGRFGLGFKSVLGVTHTPAFFSRSASFAFDAGEARELIAEIVGEREHYPVLRTARLLEPRLEAALDPILESLMEWATTVVRLPLNRRADWLESDLADFPGEFLLFSRHVGQLALRNLVTGLRREISVTADNEIFTLAEGAQAERWRLFSTVVEPTDAAKESAGKLSARDELPVQWAVPLDGRLAVGRFWAFFPLRDETTLSGIANAPWQVNDDRTALLDTSSLNREIVAGLADLVVGSVQRLVKADDPGWLLDVLPARGRELRSWGDGQVTEGVYERLADTACVPGVDGSVRKITEIKVPAEPAVESGEGGRLREVFEFWAAAPSAPADWVHPSAIRDATRRSRIDRLLDANRLRPRPVGEWLEAIVPPDATPADSAHAIRLVGLLTRSDSVAAQNRRAVTSSNVLLLSDGRMSTIDPERVFIGEAEEDEDLGYDVVHPEILEHDDCREILQRLNLREVNPEVRLELAVRRASVRGGQSEWEKVWEATRSVDDPDEAARLIAERMTGTRRPLVRTASGRWRGTDEVLLPGPVVKPADDPEVAVDIDYHADDVGVLRQLRVSATPEPGFPVEHDRVVRALRGPTYRHYLATHDHLAATPNYDYMEFAESEVCGPLGPLDELSDDARAEFTAAVLERVESLGEWTFRHKSQDRYPPMKVENPVCRWLREHGRLRTSVGLREVDAVVGAGFSRWATFLPSVRLSPEHSRALEIEEDFSDLLDDDGCADNRWTNLCRFVENSSDDLLTGSFYVAAARAGLPPPEEGVWARRGRTLALLDPSEIAVCVGPRVFSALKDLEMPALIVDEERDAKELIQRWGFTDTDDHVRSTPVWAQSGESIPIVDFFPLLRPALIDAGLESVEVVPCSELAYEVETAHGTRVEDTSFTFVEKEGLLLWLSDTGHHGLLQWLDDRYVLGLEAEDFDSIIEQRERQEVTDRLAELRDMPNEADRLVSALGRETLVKHLPIGLLDAVAVRHGEVDDSKTAELVMAVHGYETLRELRDEFRLAGFEPPDRWAGSSEARRFVRGLGFPSEYAGFRGSSRERQEFVPGPSSLGPEHEYQREMIDRIRSLLRSEEEHKRGVLSLPTGAGKTRVAVQALVESIVAEELATPVVWIAQSDELCEQAVQSWSEVWRKYGVDAQLKVSRLWDVNEADPARDGPQVVVATIDKLRNRVGDDTYAWLQGCSAVVVDEAHTAIAPSYTQVLEWLGLLTRGATMKTRCPLIGLTATPYRGYSKEEAERLAVRFGKRRFDSRSDDPYAYFQQIGVLAKVDGETLEGTTVSLTADEQGHIEQMRDVPPDVYRRIASDIGRNRAILDSLLAQDRSWPILLYAISTSHAHTIAALLRLEGVRAVSIDHTTSSDLRRRYIEEFRAGDLQVLCNYSVLTQGFDAPAVRAVYITRPTFSPNVYQQMIGRGLRGPLNGGKEDCLIVNVKDNWNQFGDQLAFQQFEHLWTR